MFSSQGGWRVGAPDAEPHHDHHHGGGWRVEDLAGGCPAPSRNLDGGCAAEPTASPPTTSPAHAHAPQGRSGAWAEVRNGAQADTESGIRWWGEGGMKSKHTRGRDLLGHLLRSAIHSVSCCSLQGRPALVRVRVVHSSCLLAVGNQQPCSPRSAHPGAALSLTCCLASTQCTPGSTWTTLNKTTGRNSRSSRRVPCTVAVIGNTLSHTLAGPHLNAASVIRRRASCLCCFVSDAFAVGKPVPTQQTNMRYCSQQQQV